MMSEDQNVENTDEQIEDQIEETVEETVEAAVEAAAEETEDNLMEENTIDVEDAGKLRKKVTVTIPQATIDAKRNEMYGELGGTAQVPGFRIGHAPRRLIEKRFGKEVDGDVRNAVIGQSLGHAIDKTELKVLGEPDLELDDIELPDTGDMTYSFEVEIAPEFDLPSLKGVAVDKRLVEVSEERIDEYVDELRGTRATFEPSEGPAADGDNLVAGAKIAVEGCDEVKRDGIALRVAPGQVEGLPLVDLGGALSGKSVGDSATLEVTVPEAHPNEDWRGKSATVEVTIKSLTSKVLPEANAEFAKGLGFEAIDELRDFVKERMSERIEGEVARDMRAQASKYLLDNTTFDLPEGVAKRHTDSVLQRQYVELLRSGMPREQLEENMTVIKAEAEQQAERELRLQFVLGKIADEMEIEITDGDLNAMVAQMAAQYQRRPEKMRQELEADGSLEQVRTSMREDAALDKILADAEVTEITEEAADAKAAAEEKPEKKAAKKTAKKAAKKTAKKAAKKTAEKSDDKTDDE
ncbi:MAG: trigger factor [Phycisphaerales bacterium]|nr:trigger factor [Phycisphaerales bacterium]